MGSLYQRELESGPGVAASLLLPYQPPPESLHCTCLGQLGSLVPGDGDKELS